MKMIGALVALVCSAAACSAAATCGGHGNRSTMLVSTEWLAAQLKDPGLVLLAVGSKADFDKAHIPGSQALDTANISAKGTQLTLELPPMAELKETFRALGVNNDSHVVLYSLGTQFQAATRVFLTLDAMGMGPKTSLLDGGLLSWQKESRAVTTDVPTIQAGTVEPCSQGDVVVDAPYVRSRLESKGTSIVDARLLGFYTGTQIPAGQRAGHMPGAANIPFSSLLDESGHLKPVETLAGLFTAAGISTGDQVVSYCHVGQQATAVYFAARYLGFDARMYDGSWQDWSAHTEFPVVVSAPAVSK